jgi:hypothetical protein
VSAAGKNNPVFVSPIVVIDGAPTVPAGNVEIFENVICEATLIEDAYDASDSMRSTIIVPAIIIP